MARGRADGAIHVLYGMPQAELVLFLNRSCAEEIARGRHRTAGRSAPSRSAPQGSVGCPRAPRVSRTSRRVEDRALHRVQSPDPGTTTAGIISSNASMPILFAAHRHHRRRRTAGHGTHTDPLLAGGTPGGAAVENTAARDRRRNRPTPSPRSAPASRAIEPRTRRRRPRTIDCVRATAEECDESESPNTSPRPAPFKAIAA